MGKCGRPVLDNYLPYNSVANVLALAYTALRRALSKLFVCVEFACVKNVRIPANALADDIDTESGLRLIVNTTPALIYSARPDGYIDFFNQHCLEFLGLPFEEISGWGWTQTIHPDDIEGLLAKWRAALDNRRTPDDESRMRRTDGKYRWMLHRNVALFDDEGIIVRWFGSSIDIDDQKSAEAALRQHGR